MKKILTGSQKSFLTNQQPKTPLGNSDNAIITTDGKNLLIKNLQTVAELGDDFETLAINKKTRRVVKAASTGLALMNYKGTWNAPVDPTDSRCIAYAALPSNPTPGDVWEIEFPTATITLSTGLVIPPAGKFTKGLGYPEALDNRPFIHGDLLFFNHSGTWEIVEKGNSEIPRGLVIYDFSGVTVTVAGVDRLFGYGFPGTSPIKYGDTRRFVSPAINGRYDITPLYFTSHGITNGYKRSAHFLDMMGINNGSGHATFYSNTGGDVIIAGASSSDMLHAVATRINL